MVAPPGSTIQPEQTSQYANMQGPPRVNPNMQWQGVPQQQMQQPHMMQHKGSYAPQMAAGAVPQQRFPYQNQQQQMGNYYSQTGYYPAPNMYQQQYQQNVYEASVTQQFIQQQHLQQHQAAPMSMHAPPALQQQQPQGGPAGAAAGGGGVQSNQQETEEDATASAEEKRQRYRTVLVTEIAKNMQDIDQRYRTVLVTDIAKNMQDIDQFNEEIGRYNREYLYNMRDLQKHFNTSECPLTPKELKDFGICRSLVSSEPKKKKEFNPTWLRGTGGGRGGDRMPYKGRQSEQHRKEGASRIERRMAKLGLKETKEIEDKANGTDETDSAATTVKKQFVAQILVEKMNTDLPAPAPTPAAPPVKLQNKEYFHDEPSMPFLQEHDQQDTYFYAVAAHLQHLQILIEKAEKERDEIAAKYLELEGKYRKSLIMFGRGRCI